jgi:hypothetical protein
VNFQSSAVTLLSAWGWYNAGNLTMNYPNKKLAELLKLANHYPSPHNGQPIELKQLDEHNFDIFFQKERGLQAAEVSFLFSYVTMGVFIYHLSLCVKALGHKFSYSLQLPKRNSMKGEGRVKFGSCTIGYDSFEPDHKLRETILFRQTSRKKYSEGLNDKLSKQTMAIATEKNMQLFKMDKENTHQAIWLNQRAVFDDMFDGAVRKELNHWLRYNKTEKQEKKDGLAYDCMELNGRAMKFIVNNYKLLRMPGVSSLLKRYYLRTMSDDSDAYYLLTPFSNEQEAFEVGAAIMKIWEAIAADGYYIHPFGTIMSNVEAHNDFLKLAHIEREDINKNFLVFIYRAGKSERPHASMRIPVNENLLRS